MEGGGRGLYHGGCSTGRGDEVIILGRHVNNVAERGVIVLICGSVVVLEAIQSESLTPSGAKSGVSTERLHPVVGRVRDTQGSDLEPSRDLQDTRLLALGVEAGTSMTRQSLTISEGPVLDRCRAVSEEDLHLRLQTRVALRVVDRHDRTIRVGDSGDVAIVVDHAVTGLRVGSEESLQHVSLVLEVGHGVERDQIIAPLVVGEALLLLRAELLAPLVLDEVSVGSRDAERNG